VEAASQRNHGLIVVGIAMVKLWLCYNYGIENHGYVITMLIVMLKKHGLENYGVTRVAL
jgi:hypothetical protein